MHTHSANYSLSLLAKSHFTTVNLCKWKQGGYDRRKFNFGAIFDILHDDVTFRFVLAPNINIFVVSMKG